MKNELLNIWKENFLKDIPIYYQKKNGAYKEYTLKDFGKLISYYQKNLKTQEEDRVIIFSENSPYFIGAYFATIFKGNIVVPVDPFLSSLELFKILRDCQPRVIFSSKNNLKVTKEAIKNLGYKPQVIILEDVHLNSFSDFSLVDRDINETMQILYTSGTTGDPKGVMLTFKNILSNIYGIDETKIIKGSDRIIVILPYFHAYPLMTTLILPFTFGIKSFQIEYLTSKDIVSTLKEAKITILTGVPKLFQLFLNGIYKKIEDSKLKKITFSFLTGITRTLDIKHLKKLFFKKLHEEFAPFIRYFISGGAKLPVKIAQDFYNLGYTILEGYGLTETSPVISFNRPNKFKIGSVGLPIKYCKVKIDKDGEILVKGPNVMKGYFNKIEETQAVFNNQGYFKTGDLGKIDEENFLYITGRKKDLIVLDTGKKIFPEDIENRILQSPFIEECALVYIDGKLALIVKPYEEFYKYPGLEKILKEEIFKKLKTLQSWQRPKEIKITFENLPKTRIGKLKRFLLKDIYQELTKRI
ncbi:MAG TPA: long-chain fatty acid--CoA ligase [Desulfurobacteriaceae bacterium]|nr:long-chain fatty acid--CoA ligase [Desulfurobacteriaceae bacterium]